jgi:NADH:ubiquinone oxidoreductase subunit F (NADH-binding)/(2Fe-2S) ferredoxin/Pyruvate/2-oxoacid:ferredoxin oxidoreductase delta subunit
MTLSEFQEWRERVRKTLALRLGQVPPEQAAAGPYRKREVLVCAGGACVSCGNQAISQAFRDQIGKTGLAEYVKLVDTGCVGSCDLGVVVQIMPDNVLYQKVVAANVKDIVERHLMANEVVTELLPTNDKGEPYHSPAEMPFFKHQQKIVLENSGIIDPQSIDEYVARDGYAALAKVLGEMQPQDVVTEMITSGLRGRGGGGFVTGKKWGMLASSPKPRKYIICNGDEGDPGAFMDRSVLESDPHRVLEGMLIAGYATGAQRGVLYVRAEYPLAIKRLQIAIQQARQKNLLGENVLGTKLCFDVEIRVGAGAFVCGEETALIASVEGRRGMPQPRPPFPTQAGLYGQPTIINNVETYANVPTIIRKGGEWFSKIGSPKSPGTKVFALAGKLANTGLVEVPMGMPLRKLVFEIGGGVPDGREFKAAQTGGPSGGCIPANHLDTPMDFDSLQQIGSIMGSGGLIVMDDTSCMVDVARFFMDFCVDESCGKCPPCRVGTKQMLHMLGKITDGKANEDDLDKLLELCGTVTAASLCGLGMTAPNPVRSTLRHFRSEYETHIRDRKCPAAVCRHLLTFAIALEKCTGCSLCAKSCPTNAISKYDGTRKYQINTEACIHCGSCFDVCRFGAVTRS